MLLFPLYNFMVSGTAIFTFAVIPSTKKLQPDHYKHYLPFICHGYYHILSKKCRSLCPRVTKSVGGWVATTKKMNV